jgi:5'-methylthioadenosine phosphorylase
MKKIGLIGGSGLEKLSLFTTNQELQIKTPYGEPSSAITQCEFDNGELFILSRHGREHSITPTHVNNRANINALKQLGCEAILATTACGSLREEIGRGHIVIPDQFIDFTVHRKRTFFDVFEGGQINHTPMADPFSEPLRNLLIETARELNLTCHPNGTVVTIEGPRFSTRAESKMFRILGADVINMSTAPEATLANEAGIPYAAIALSTDYDSWKQDEEPVTWDEIKKIFEENISNVTELLIAVLRKIKKIR